MPQGLTVTQNDWPETTEKLTPSPLRTAVLPLGIHRKSGNAPKRTPALKDHFLHPPASEHHSFLPTQISWLCPFLNIKADDNFPSLSTPMLPCSEHSSSSLAWNLVLNPLDPLKSALSSLTIIIKNQQQFLPITALCQYRIGRKVTDLCC